MVVLFVPRRHGEEQPQEDGSVAARNMTRVELADVARRRGISCEALLDDARARGIVIDD
jgi:hypothetical protein